jgi:hypothetical protein
MCRRDPKLHKFLLVLLIISLILFSVSCAKKPIWACHTENMGGKQCTICYKNTKKIVKCTDKTIYL